MSYCVNCGVELADSQKRCPLCGVEAINPAKPRIEPASGPYPGRVEYIIRRVDRRYGALLAAVGLAIPVLCSILIDIFMTREISWSGYVTGAAVCLFVWVLLPMLLRRPNIYLLILYDTAALQAYVAGICLMNGGIMPYVTFAMPLIFAACAFAYAAAVVLRARRLEGTLYKPAIVSFMTGLLLVAVELVTDLNLQGSFQPLWSLIAATPCLVVGGMLILLEGKQKLKDKIRRRLFV